MWSEMQISSSTVHIPPGGDPMSKLSSPPPSSPARNRTKPSAQASKQVWEAPKHDGPSGSSIFHVVQASGLPKIDDSGKPEAFLRKIYILLLLLLVLRKALVLLLFQQLIIFTFKNVHPFSPDRKLCQQISQANQCPDSLPNI